MTNRIAHVAWLRAAAEDHGSYPMAREQDIGDRPANDSNVPPSTGGVRLGQARGHGATLARGVCGAVLLGSLACAGTPAQQTARGTQELDPCRHSRAGDAESGQRRAPAAGPELSEPDLLLLSAARAHAEQFARTGRISHEGSDGSTPAQRVTAAGYVTSVGKNVAAGQTSPEEVVTAWMKPEPHRRSLLNPRFTAAAVATIDAPATRWETYWVMGVRRGPTDARARLGPLSSMTRRATPGP